MEPVATPAAPAQPAESTPATISATLDAANRGDFSAFDAADSAAKRGKPLPTVEHDTEPAAPASAAPAERTLSKRQEEANDRTRKAVEAATADLRAELDRVKAQIAAPAKSPEPVATPPAAKTPEWKRYMAMPDAPKLEEFDSVAEHTAAMALFITETRDTERATDAQNRQTDESRAKFLDDAGQKFGERIQEAVKADPDFRSKIAATLLEARPYSGLSDDEQPKATLANLAAETALFSKDPFGLYTYLTSHREVAEQIASLPSKDHALRALAQLDGELTAGRSAATAPATDVLTPPAAPRAAVPSTVTAAPPPVTTVSRAGSTADPQKAALARGDFGAFDRIEMDKKRAQRGAA